MPEKFERSMRVDTAAVSGTVVVQIPEKAQGELIGALGDEHVDSLFRIFCERLGAVIDVSDVEVSLDCETTPQESRFRAVYDVLEVVGAVLAERPTEKNYLTCRIGSETAELTVSLSRAMYDPSRPVTTQYQTIQTCMKSGDYGPQRSTQLVSGLARAIEMSLYLSYRRDEVVLPQDQITEAAAFGAIASLIGDALVRCGCGMLFDEQFVFGSDVAVVGHGRVGVPADRCSVFSANCQLPELAKLLLSAFCENSGVSIHLEDCMWRPESLVFTLIESVMQSLALTIQNSMVERPDQVSVVRGAFHEGNISLTIRRNLGGPISVDVTTPTEASGLADSLDMLITALGQLTTELTADLVVEINGEAFSGTAIEQYVTFCKLFGLAFNQLFIGPKPE